MSKKRTQKRRTRDRRKRRDIIHRRTDYVYPTSMDNTG